MNSRGFEAYALLSFGQCMLSCGRCLSGSSVVLLGYWHLLPDILQFFFRPGFAIAGLLLLLLQLFEVFLQRNSLRFDALRLGCHLLQLRSEEHTSELQSLMRISSAVLCLKKTKNYSPNSHR